MKVVALLLISLAITSFAASTDMKSKLAALMTVKAQATDAVDSALQLLRDLIQAEQDEQATHEANHKEEIINGEAEIRQLSDTRDQIRHECDNGIEHVQFIDAEIADTNSHIAWIQARVETLTRQREELESGRCESNSIFIQSLREHMDALEVIAFLRGDLANWQSAQSSGFAQVNSVTDKLKAYSHLFEKNALKEFLSLGEPKAWDELTDGTTRREIDAAHVDNNRDALSLDNFESGTSSRDLSGSLTDRINALLDTLQAHLEASIEDLKANEIKAAYDLANWLDHSDEELAGLAADTQRKNTYLSKLTIDRDVAQSYVDACEERHTAAVNAVQASIDNLNARKAWFASETDRRNGEIALLEECIAIFTDKVSSMKDYLRERIEDYQPDQTFDQTSLRGR